MTSLEPFRSSALASNMEKEALRSNRRTPILLWNQNQAKRQGKPQNKAETTPPSRGSNLQAVVVMLCLAVLLSQALELGLRGSGVALQMYFKHE